jgi:hypothetical protein
MIWGHGLFCEYVAEFLSLGDERCVEAESFEVPGVSRIQIPNIYKHRLVSSMV